MDWISHPTDCIPTMIDWLYPVRHKTCISCCLLNVIFWLASKLTTHVGNSVNFFLEQTFVSCCNGKLFPPIVMVAIVQPDLTRFFWFVSLGVNDYPWEIIGMDFVTDFYSLKVQNSSWPLLMILVCHLKCHVVYLVTRNQRTWQSRDYLYWPMLSTSCCSISHWMCSEWQPCLVGKFGYLVGGNWIPSHNECG